MQREADLTCSLKEDQSMSSPKFPMHPDLQVGAQFPDFELKDHDGTMQNLRGLLRGFPGALIFGRGHY